MAAGEGKEYTVTPSPYPANTKTETASIKGIETTATSVYFADKILITISQHGRLAHWVRFYFYVFSHAFKESNNIFYVLGSRPSRYRLN